MGEGRSHPGLVLLLLAVCALLSSCAFLRGYAAGRSTQMLAAEAQHARGTDIGMIRFAFDDLGSLNTDTLRTTAIPWKVAAAALVLDHSARHRMPIESETLRALLSSFGFTTPSSIENWGPATPPPTFEKPLGIITGRVSRSVPRIELEVANLSCAACHAGVLYDRNGLPQNRVWLGLPNTSINLEAYSQAVYQGLKRTVRSREKLLPTIRRLFPDTTEAELRTIEHHVIPRIEAKLSELQKSVDAPTPFPNGGPGLTNGVGALKFQLGLLAPDRQHHEVGYTSIPDLGSVAVRSSLLSDGLYMAPGATRFERLSTRRITDQHVSQLARIVSFFTVPAMGVTAETARAAIPRIEEIFRFILSYRPPSFPGPIDAAFATKGREIYHDRCARCHGTYSEGIADVRLIEFPNRLSPQEEMNTDPERWRAITPELIQAIKASPYRQHIVPQATNGYVAPRLTALWATAPYLHNGSVPTLWHLMHPEARPRRFYVGGHRLDFERVGIAGVVDTTGTLRYPEGYEPWAAPDLYDTSKPGLSNEGHEREFDSLSEAEKENLLEYLKLL
ncbi:MAG: hypothetical protein ACE5MG_14100 [Candidatus Methylomirabilales bacterium]